MWHKKDSRKYRDSFGLMRKVVTWRVEQVFSICGAKSFLFDKHYSAVAKEKIYANKNMFDYFQYFAVPPSCFTLEKGPKFEKKSLAKGPIVDLIEGRSPSRQKVLHLASALMEHFFDGSVSLRLW